jgi:hypothetical protein
MSCISSPPRSPMTLGVVRPLVIENILSQKHHDQWKQRNRRMDRPGSNGPRYGHGMVCHLPRLSRPKGGTHRKLGHGNLERPSSTSQRAPLLPVYPPSVEKAVAGGCVPAKSPTEAAKGASVLGFMVVSVAQVEDLLFGEARVADGIV